MRSDSPWIHRYKNKNRQKKEVSWDLGNESKKKLFEDAVTEEETDNCNTPVVTETILEETPKEEQNESNTSCPLDGELKPTSCEIEFENGVDEAEHLTDFEAEQRSIKTCLIHTFKRRPTISSLDITIGILTTAWAALSLAKVKSLEMSESNRFPLIWDKWFRTHGVLLSNQWEMMIIASKSEFSKTPVPVS